MEFTHNGVFYTNNCTYCKFLYIENDIVYCIHNTNVNAKSGVLGRYQLNIGCDDGLVELSSYYLNLNGKYDHLVSTNPIFVPVYKFAVWNGFTSDLLNAGILIENDIISF